MYQIYKSKGVYQKKTNKRSGYKESTKISVFSYPLNFYSEYNFMINSPKNCIIQKYNDETRKSFSLAEALRVLGNICTRHSTTLEEINVDIHNINNYYNQNAKYTERELAEEFSMTLREELIVQHDFPKRNLRDSIYEGHDISTEEGMVYCIKSFLKKMIFYHFTRDEFAERILSEGVNPIHGGVDTGISRANGGSRADTYAKWSKGFVFVTRNSTDIASYSPGKTILYVLAAEEDMRIDVDSHGLKSKKILMHVGRADSPVTEGAVNFVLNQMLSNLYIPSEMQEKLPGLIRANFKWDRDKL